MKITLDPRKSMVQAIEMGDDDRVDSLSNFASLKTVTDVNGISALGVAAMRKNTFAVKKLLEKGWDVNFTDMPKRLTPLHLAARYGTVEILKMLLSAGALISVRDKVHDWTPLQMAVTKKRLDTTAVLLERGAKVERTDLENSDGDLHEFLQKVFDSQRPSTKTKSKSVEGHNGDNDDSDSEYNTATSSNDAYCFKVHIDKKAGFRQDTDIDTQKIRDEETRLYEELSRQFLLAKRQVNDAADEEEKKIWEVRAAVLKERIKAEKQQMQIRIFNRINPRQETTLDLHRLDKDGAIEKVQEHLDFRCRSREIHCLKLITGRGRHSQNTKAVIRPAVIELLHQRNLLFDVKDDNLGVFYVSFPQ